MKNYMYRRPIEYVMSSGLAKELLKNRTGEDKRKNGQQSLCEYVNRDCGLLGNCVKVVIVD